VPASPPPPRHPPQTFSVFPFLSKAGTPKPGLQEKVLLSFQPPPYHASPPGRIPRWNKTSFASKKAIMIRVPPKHSLLPRFPDQPSTLFGSRSLSSKEGVFVPSIKRLFSFKTALLPCTSDLCSPNRPFSRGRPRPEIFLTMCRNLPLYVPFPPAALLFSSRNSLGASHSSPRSRFLPFLSLLPNRKPALLSPASSFEPASTRRGLQSSDPHVQASLKIAISRPRKRSVCSAVDFPCSDTSFRPVP